MPQEAAELQACPTMQPSGEFGKRVAHGLVGAQDKSEGGPVVQTASAHAS